MALRTMLPVLLAAAAAAAPAQTPASSALNPRAIELFQKDWVLMDWALRFHDRDRNGELSIAEADAGARAFKEMADADGDGRVTTQEFAAARQFLVARY
ncbi:MAG TPA: hypothetical protein VM265_00320 [Sphingomicrobium sp.]|nr:hypothetical protein [Sphingomicrobium sp.]